MKAGREAELGHVDKAPMGIPPTRVAMIRSRPLCWRSALVRGLLSDEEWPFFVPFVIESGPLRRRPPRNQRRTLDAIFWTARTYGAWRDLTEELGNWNSVHWQHRRWTACGLGEYELAGKIDVDEEVELIFNSLDLADVDVEIADGIGLEALAGRLVALGVRQAADSWALRASVQG